MWSDSAQRVTVYPVVVAVNSYSPLLKVKRRDKPGISKNPYYIAKYAITIIFVKGVVPHASRIDTSHGHFVHTFTEVCKQFFDVPGPCSMSTLRR